MSEWKCGNCGKVYNINEFISLKKIKMVESDTDPGEQHGYTPMCDCGYRFHLDRWRIDDHIKINVDEKESELTISTIYLELNHKTLEDEKDEYYETAILWPDKTDGERGDIQIIERYDTKENAIGGHNKILELINNDKYKIEKTTILENEENSIVFEE